MLKYVNQGIGEETSRLRANKKHSQWFLKEVISTKVQMGRQAYAWAVYLFNFKI